MDAKEKQLVQAVVECEGFDYALRHYSSFDEVKDIEFHRLRLQYIEAATALIDYAGIEE